MKPAEASRETNEVAVGGRRPIRTADYGDVLYIDFVEGRPFSVITTEGTYDFEYSRTRDTTYFREGGSGNAHRAVPLPRWVNPEGTAFWAADSVDLRYQDDWDAERCEYRTDRSATPEDIARLGLSRLDEATDPFADATETEGRLLECSICDDWFEEGDSCRHIWVSRSGENTGPGAGEDGAAECKDAFLRLAKTAGIVRGLRKGLSPFSWRIDQLHAVGGLGSSYVWVTSAGTDLGNVASKLDQYDDTLIDGAAWLLALGPETDAANSLTAAWLDEIIAEQDARRRSDERAYVVRVGGWRYVCEEGADGATPLTANIAGAQRQRSARRVSWEEAIWLRRALIASRRQGDIAIVHIRPRGTRRRA